MLSWLQIFLWCQGFAGFFLNCFDSIQFSQHFWSSQLWRCISQNISCRQQNTADNLQKAVTYPKSLIHLAKWSVCVNEWVLPLKWHVPLAVCKPGWSKYFDILSGWRWTTKVCSPSSHLLTYWQSCPTCLHWHWIPAYKLIDCLSKFFFIPFYWVGQKKSVVYFT